MASILNADNGVISGVSGLKYSADNSGILAIQTNGTTAITVNADQTVTFAGAVSFASSSFTNLSYTGTLTGGTGVVNIGSGQFYKDVSGNVGLGTITPGAQFVVSSSSVGLEVSPNNGGSCYLTSYNRNTTDYFQMSMQGSTLYFLSGATGSNSERMRIDSSGNIGINGAPIVKFQINTSGTAASTNWVWMNANSLNPPAGATYGLLVGGNLSSGSSETNLVWGQGVGSSQHLAIGKWTGSAYTEQMRIDSSNNVMIGTTSAFGKFGVVSGSAYFSVAPTTYTSAQFGPRPANDGISSVLFSYGASNGDFWKIDAAAAGLNFAQSVGSTGYIPLSISNAGNMTLYGTSTNSTYMSFANGSSGGRSYALFSTGSANGAGLPAGYFGIFDNTAGTARLWMDTAGNVTIGSSLGVTSTISGNTINAGGSFTGQGSFVCYFTSNINANANTAPGVIGSYASSATNAPDNSGILWNGMSGPGNGTQDGGQLWQNYNNNAFYARKRWGGGFSAWQYIGG